VLGALRLEPLCVSAIRSRPLARLTRPQTRPVAKGAALAGHAQNRRYRGSAAARAAPAPLAWISVAACYPGLADGQRRSSSASQPIKKERNPVTGNITPPGHVRIFQAIRSPIYDNITLTGRTINADPGAAIVMVDDAGQGKVAVMPLFVAITPGMTFPGEGDSDGGGPKNPREANKAMTGPSPH
jgi:hypothetical protein